MDKINVSGNKLFVSNGEIVLRGVSIPDYLWLVNREKQDIKSVISKIKSLGFNAVRVPVLPGNFVYYDNFIETFIKKIVDLCVKLNLYCLLNWHAVGNPIYNETRLINYFHVKNNKKIFWYSADRDVALKGIERIARIFGGYDNVMFEIFNEPCPKENEIPKLNLSGLPWDKLRAFESELISVVRKYSKNLIVVASNFWSFNLKDTSKSPFLESGNIAYSFHNYPIKHNQDWKDMLDSMKEYPVIVTEFGYDSDPKSLYHSSYDSFLKPFLNYVSNNSWFAWCFSASWRPRMVLSWEPFELSEFGHKIINGFC